MKVATRTTQKCVPVDECLPGTLVRSRSGGWYALSRLDRKGLAVSATRIGDGAKTSFSFGTLVEVYPDAEVVPGEPA